MKDYIFILMVTAMTCLINGRWELALVLAFLAAVLFQEVLKGAE